MQTVETTFKISYSEGQYQKAIEYIEDMKKHPKRVFWVGKKDKSDEELIYSHIAHKILSGFYNNYDPAFASKQIMEMTNKEVL